MQRLVVAAAVMLLIACTRAEAEAPTWATSEVRAFERARAEHRGVMVELHAAWSTASEELDKKLHAPAFAAEIGATFVAVRIDVTNDDDKTVAARKRYGAETLPHVVFMSVKGDVLGRVTTMVDDEALHAIIKSAASRVSR